MLFFADSGSFYALLQVVMIDLVLAGDNAVVIGLAAASVHPSLRRKAIIFGILAATVLRIVFALIATQLLAIVGLLLAGGLLLAWVCWKMWQELRTPEPEPEVQAEFDIGNNGTSAKHTKNFRQAVMHILIADVSMSLDNVLAVAGAARDHPMILAFGLLLSIALMGLAASFIANLLNKHRWIAYIGLVIIAFVALRMIFHGAEEVLLTNGHGGIGQLMGFGTGSGPHA